MKTSPPPTASPGPPPFLRAPHPPRFPPRGGMWGRDSGRPPQQHLAGLAGRGVLEGEHLEVVPVRQRVLGEDVGAGETRGGGHGSSGANPCPSRRPEVWGHLQGHLELLQPLLLQLARLEEELVALQPGRVDEQEGVGPLRARGEAVGARDHQTGALGATKPGCLGPPRPWALGFSGRTPRFPGDLGPPRT